MISAKTLCVFASETGIQPTEIKRAFARLRNDSHCVPMAS